jgi:hypothetical protein
MAILDYYLKVEKCWTPRTPREFVALQLARKLADVDRIREYVALLEHFPEERVFRAFRNAVARGSPKRECFAAAFRELTEHPNDE